MHLVLEMKRGAAESGEREKMVCHFTHTQNQPATQKNSTVTGRDVVVTSWPPTPKKHHKKHQKKEENKKASGQAFGQKTSLLPSLSITLLLLRHF